MMRTNYTTYFHLFDDWSWCHELEKDNEQAKKKLEVQWFLEYESQT